MPKKKRKKSLVGWMCKYSRFVIFGKCDRYDFLRIAREYHRKFKKQIPKNDVPKKVRITIEEV